jgi:hypothetical protein
MLPKEISYGGFTVLYCVVFVFYFHPFLLQILKLGLINVLSWLDIFLTLAEPYLGNSVSPYSVFENMNQKRE